MSLHSHKLLDDMGHSQKGRLFHIDFKLRFVGSFNRNDLLSLFGIKAAAATRDISLYKDIAPKNLTYDTKAKAYIKADNFKPVFDYSGIQALSALCYGLSDDHIATSSGIEAATNNALITSEMPTHLNSPNLDVLAEVTKAIYQKKILRIKYRSLSSGQSTREIVPFVLVDNGLRWHVRAFDRKRERFTDFVINRISNPKILDIDPPNKQTKEADIQWNRIVEMRIVPHPRLKHPETIEAEYAMAKGMLNVQIRAAVAGYVLRRWNVDCSKNHSLDRPEIHLWLNNQQTLYGVDNLAIAPGYSA